MEHFVNLVDILVWPGLIGGLFYFFKNPIKDILPFLSRLKIKDFELDFRANIDEIKEDVGDDALGYLEESDANNELLSLVNISTTSAVAEAWQLVQVSARRKVEELTSGTALAKWAIERPTDYLEHTGALIPSTKRAIRNMRELRNRSVHLEEVSMSLSKEAALEYINIAKAIAHQIDGITDLPKVKLTALTLFVLEINQLIDTGKFNDISIDEVYDAIESKSIFPFLRERTKGTGLADFSLYSDDGPYSSFVVYYHDAMESLYQGYAGQHRRKWGVEKLGLCLLLAWTNELIQQGAGWYPSDNE